MWCLGQIKGASLIVNVSGEREHRQLKYQIVAFDVFFAVLSVLKSTVIYLPTVSNVKMSVWITFIFHVEITSLLICY